MPHRPGIRVHSYLTHAIDELSLADAPNKHGECIELCVTAFGEAEIAYDRDGDWNIASLRIDGHRRNYGSGASWLKDSAELPPTHQLYPVIIAALHELSWQDIQDQVERALAEERECV